MNRTGELTYSPPVLRVWLYAVALAASAVGIPSAQTPSRVERPTATLVGEARSADNRALPNATVQLRDAVRGSIVARAETDVRGQFVFTGLAQGAYIVELTAQPISLEPGRPTQIVGAASQLITVNPGETKATLVRTPTTMTVLATPADAQAVRATKRGQQALARIATAWTRTKSAFTDSPISVGLHLFRQALVSCLGALLLYIAFFLDEDEEGKLKNRLEQTWRDLTTAQERALGRQQIFVGTIARMTSDTLDHIFGARLISLTSISVSACYSLGATGLALAILLVYALDFTSYQAVGPYRDLWVPLLICSGWTILGLLPTFSRRLRWVSVLGFSSVVCFIFVVVLVDLRWIEPSGWFDNLVGWMASAIPWIEFVDERPAYVILILMLTIVSDFIVIVSGRRFMRSLANEATIFKVLLFSIVTLVLPLVLCAVPTWLSFVTDDNQTASVLLLVGLSNSYSAVVTLLFLILAIVALLHRFFWPLIRRPIMAAHRHGLLNQRKLLAGVGLALMAIGSPFGRSVAELVKRLHISVG